MLNYLQNKFALSEEGSKDLVKGSLYSALANLSMMMPVGLFILMLSEVLNPLLGKEANTPNLVKYIVLIVVTVIIMFLLHYVQYSSVFVSTYKESATRRIRLATKLKQLPLSFFGKRDLSDLTNTIMSDCTSLEHAFSHAIPQLFGAIISTTIIVIGLISMDWRMGLSVLWVIPVAFIIILTSKKFQSKSKIIHFVAKRSCADGIQECLENIQDIKAYNMSESYIEELDKKLDNAEKEQIRAELIGGACVTSAQAILRLGLATVVLVGSTLLISGETDLFTYLVFLITASRLYDPLSSTLINIAEIFIIEVPINRMKEMENQPIQTGVTEYELKSYDIEFNHVAFSYNENEPVLKDISFVAKQGEVTAIVGPSGSGKSTLIKLISRFWDVDDGKILIGKDNIREMKSEHLMQYISIVFQDVVLFNDTIYNNIKIGNKNATEQEIKDAAKLAGCEEFIKNLPEGYQSLLGENGCKLSGGERQRISIARALLKNAPIIILDEATSSLDPKNEDYVQKGISKLIRGKTVIVIAHKLRTIENVDKIVVLNEGKVEEVGNHVDLIKENGLYNKLYTLQDESARWSVNS
jgi:ATP-binding cassette subfamily B protein